LVLGPLDYERARDVYASRRRREYAAVMVVPRAESTIKDVAKKRNDLLTHTNVRAEYACLRALRRPSSL
jgi:hypothetical protein